MDSVVDKLTKQFLPENRFKTFGPIILSLDISGIKGTNCSISFDFPITAIAGYNGAGKSTIAQIALCMYRSLDENTGNSRKYLKDFFVKTMLDKSPYAPDASIKVHYAAEKDHSAPEQMTLFGDHESQGNIKILDVHYSTDRWAGYKHQPQKSVYYYGMSYFIPYQEQNSNLLKDSNANVTNTNKFDDKIVKTVADILSINYTVLLSNNISNKKRTENVLSANKSTASYSENHMGCGEGRLLKLVYALETAPKQSLFVIEEPETALHQLAQHKLSQYFLDVCERKKHQIIFTTHSPDIQRALPSQARKYIQREEDGTTSVVDSPSIAQINNYLSGGHYKKMIVVTEDKIGMRYIKEILRAYCIDVFNNCDFFAMDLGYMELKKYVCQSQNCGIKIYGIVDENRRADIEKNVLAFPEEQPPEVSMFTNQFMIDFIKNEFNFDCSSLSCDHHEFFNRIAKVKNEDKDYVINRCIKTYIKNNGEEYYKGIVDTMSQWLHTCNS